MGAYETILYDQADGVATLTINRPDQFNGMTTDVHQRRGGPAAGAARNSRFRIFPVAPLGNCWTISIVSAACRPRPAAHSSAQP